MVTPVPRTPVKPGRAGGLGRVMTHRCRLPAIAHPCRIAIPGRFDRHGNGGRSPAGRLSIAVMHNKSIGQQPPRLFIIGAASRRYRISPMKLASLVSPLRWLGFVVLLLMATAVVYAGFIAISNWPSIAV